MNILILYRDVFKKLNQRYCLINYLNKSINNLNALCIEGTSNVELQNIIKKNNINIIVFFIINISNLKNLKKISVSNSNIKKYYYILDNYHFNFYPQIDNIILPFKYDIIKKLIPKKSVYNFQSRYFDPTIYKDYKLFKKYDILIYGTRDFIVNINANNKHLIKKIYKNKRKIDVYSLRTKLENIILQNRQKYNIKILPNSKNGNHAVIEAELSKLINQSYLTVCCSSIFDYLLFKHLEIPASNSVILGDYPSDYEEDFKNNIVNIDFNMTEKEIITIIDDALKDKKKLLEKSKRMHDIVNKKYRIENCVNDFKNIIGLV